MKCHVDAIQWGGGGVVAEFFGVSSETLRDSVGEGGGRSAEFFFSMTSKRHFPLMWGPFLFFYFPEGGGPGPPGPPLNRPLLLTGLIKVVWYVNCLVGHISHSILTRSSPNTTDLHIFVSPLLSSW